MFSELKRGELFAALEQTIRRTLEQIAQKRFGLVAVVEVYIERLSLAARNLIYITRAHLR
jgi:hypothetical protein